MVVCAGARSARGLALVGGLVIMLLLAPAPVLARIGEFSDTRGHWAQRELQLLAAHGVVDGYPDGTFRPGDPVTRAQFTKMLVTALGRVIPPPGVPAVFTDVPSRHWAFSYIAAAWEADLAQGVGGGRFDPDVSLRRSELAVLVDRALGGGAAADEPSPAFPWRDEQEIPDWARSAVNRMAGLGVVRGFEDGSFRPSLPATRAETAAVIARLLEQAGLAYHLLGTLEVLEDDRLVMAGLGDGSRLNVRLSSEIVYWRNGRVAARASLRPLDEVGVVLVGGRAAYLEAWQLDNLGVLESMDAAAGRLTFRDASGRQYEAVVAPGAQVFRNGRRATAGSLRAGDHVYLLFSTFDGRVRLLDAVAVHSRGSVHALDVAGGTIRILVGQGRVLTLDLGPTLVVLLDGERVGPDRLRVGDLLYLAVDSQSRVSYMEAYRYVPDPRR